MPARLLSAGLLVVGVAYAIVLFLPWSEGLEDDFGISALTGLDGPPGFLSFATVVGLVLWELVSVFGIRRTVRADSLVAFFLAASTGLTGIASVVHMKWGNPYPGTDDLDYGAFLAIPLSGLLVTGGVAHLVLHLIAQRPDLAR